MLGAVRVCRGDKGKMFASLSNSLLIVLGTSAVFAARPQVISRQRSCEGRHLHLALPADGLPPVSGTRKPSFSGFCGQFGRSLTWRPLDGRYEHLRSVRNYLRCEPGRSAGVFQQACQLAYPPPNKACTGLVGTVRLFEHFSGFEFFSAPEQSQRPAHQPVTPAVRCPATCVRN